jgi:hypothetical protein
MEQRLAASLLVLALVGVPAAAAPPTPAARCEAAKNRAAGRFAACVQEAQARAVEKGEPLDVAKCSAKLTVAWAKAEARAEKQGASCPTEDDRTAIGALVEANGATLGGALAGEGVPSCGNGAVDVAGEECDLSDLGGRTCADFGYPAGALACDGSCRFDASTCDACPGVQVGLYCYVLGADGGSCDAACGAAGLVYDPATQLHSGGGGSDLACSDVLDALGVPNNGLSIGPCGIGIGCVYAPGLSFRSRCTDVTTGSAALGGQRRACSCR